VVAQMKGKVKGYSVFTAVQYPGFEWVVGQVKYLGGITFLLNDGCPETAEQDAISQYFQCIQTEKLHVRQ
jgi:hypothetical protein